jgi:hypothetical protein
MKQSLWMVVAAIIGSSFSPQLRQHRLFKLDPTVLAKLKQILTKP